jgi:GTPase SAR1 family protein
VLVGNKSDLDQQYSWLSRRKVSFEEASALAHSLGMSYTETSAAADSNVHVCFKSLAQAIYGRVTSSQLIPDSQGSQGVKISNKRRLAQLQQLSSNIDEDSGRLSKSTGPRYGPQGQSEQGCCG